MPIFNPDDKVIVSSIPYVFSRPKRGDIVVFKYHNKFMVKKISKEIDERFYIEGENKNDSLNVGRISRKDILGKVITKI